MTNKSGIHIKASRVGTFTAAAKAAGRSVSEEISAIEAHPDDYSEAMRKKEVFAKNARSWHHK